jgi:hypothetical protein
MSKIIVAMALAVTACGGWTKRDTLGELSYVTVATMDWQQTRTITQDCDETNPIIGRCGQNVPMDVYFPVTTVAHVLVSAVLPKGWWRTSWQSLTVGVEVSTVWSNYHLGYGLDGPGPRSSFNAGRSR